MNYTPNEARYDSMTYVRCGASGLKLPALSLGLWHNFGTADSYEVSAAIARKAFDLGITHFDLANNYGPPPGIPCGPARMATGDRANISYPV